ncbi:LppX_LprAFG lipoprotein [Streptomyces sp. NPDC089919]|uniref:LppX_LprAFG lipoprotein n=1 Tax=Streptomyces sp. NPDC089919 TaxID=3155188 RepID=UPI003436F353
MSTYRKKTAVRTATAVLAAALLAGGATACDDGKKDAAGPAKTAAAKPGGSGAVDAAPAAYLQKVQDKSKQLTSVRYTMSGTSAGNAIAGEAAMRLKPQVAMSMKMSDPAKPAESFEMRLVDGAMYMGAGGKWLKFDMKSADPTSAAQLEKLGKGSQNAENPGDRASQLSAAKDLKKVGEETIDGQKTVHLAGTVTVADMKASVAAAEPDVRARRQQQLDQLVKQGVSSMVMDMWIDDATGFTKQFRMRGAAKQGPMDLTMKFLDYNKPVDVAAPPADQVTDLGALMKNKGGTAGATG